MTQKYFLKLILLISLFSLGISIIPSAVAQEELNQVLLYYEGSGGLSTNAPTDVQSQTFSVGPSSALTSITIGGWHTDNLVKSFKISGAITTTIWASGRGFAYFEFRLFINDEPMGDIITTDTTRLSQSPQEFSGTQTGVDLEVSSNSMFGLEARIYFTGTRCTVYWGSSEHPAHIMVSCDSVAVSNPSFEINSDSQRITLNSTFISAFGLEDIASYNIQITGPTPIEHISESNIEIENEQMTVYWIWEYGKDNIKIGEEYSVTAIAEDNNGNRWSKESDDVIILKSEEEISIPSDIIQIIVIIIIILIIGFLITYKLFFGKYVEEKISLLRSNTEYFSDYKLIIVSEVLHSLTWYLLLVISLFIFRASWGGWGDFLVGLNYGLYQTVSVLLFLSLAKESDVHGTRKNLLLSLIIIGTILLFIMAWLSFVPNPVITIVIIILFTLFVLCYYGTDNLELALITEYFPEKIRGKAYGILRAIGNIGGLIGGVLSGFLFDIIGFWFCFMLAGFVMLASFFVLFSIRDVGVIEEKITISNWLGNFIASTKESGNKLKNWLKKVSQALDPDKIENYLFNFQKKKQMTLLFSTTLFTLIAYGMIVPFIMVFLSEARGESATVLGIVYTVFGVAIFLPINQIAAGWLCDKYGARKVYAGAIFAYIGLWGMFNLTIPLTSSNVLIMIVFIFPIWPFLWIGYKMFVADLTPRTERVRGLTSIRLALGIGIVIGSIGGGILLYFLSYETVFQLAMIFTFIAVVLAMVLLKATSEDD